MRTFALALCAALLAAAAGLARPPPTPASRQVSPVLALLGERPPLRLGLVDAQTFRPLPGKRLDAGSGGCASRDGGTGCWTTPAWAYSPDRSLLALARNDGFSAGSLRIVDVRRMRVTEDVPLKGLPLGGLAWMAPGRVLALQEVCCSETQQVVAIDLSRRRVEASRKLGGSIVRIARTKQELVLLLAPPRAIGPARLALVDPRGAVRSVSLRGVAAGSKVVDYTSFLMERQLPGLALDAAGRRAFVVGPGVVVEIDLRTLSVAYHPQRATASVAKASRGAIREARWLGSGLLAVTGEQLSAAAGEQRSEPAGLVVIDTKTWSVRTVDPRATAVVVWRDLLLATAPSPTSGGAAGFGLAAYGFDGSLRFRLLEDKAVWGVTVDGTLADVGVAGTGGKPAPLVVVDLTTGAVVGERSQSQPLPILVTAAAASWWESPF